MINQRPTWVNSYNSLIQHFRLSVAMATNQNEECVQLLYAWWRTTQQTFIKKGSVKIPAVRNFHFSHYKWIETLSCHSNETTWATAIKNKLFVEANVMNISAKFQLHPPYGFWGDDFLIFFLRIYPFSCHGNQSNSAIWTKFMFAVEDFSRNSSVKRLLKYLQWDSNKDLLSLFPS